MEPRRRVVLLSKLDSLIEVSMYKSLRLSHLPFKRDKALKDADSYFLERLAKVGRALAEEELAQRTQDIEEAFWSEQRAIELGLK